ncbi:dynamin family protein [Dialister sp.]|uniref:dynamin family protein n=1 Tax=Dialister sp. TaxID=1955814 RepID=UPI002E80C93B|nr:dynamin family protein [Dialister sp.]MEE3452834.1 dynamin family protein [Dialister sp.]
MISLWLKKHPVLSESIPYKIKYLSVLEYFTRKYGQKNIVSQEILKLYKKYFLGEYLEKYEYTFNNIESCIRKVSLGRAVRKASGQRRKRLYFYSYPYVLAMDCLLMNAFQNEETGKKILDEIGTSFCGMYYETNYNDCNLANVNILEGLNELRTSIYENGSLSRALYGIAPLMNVWRENENHLKKPAYRILVTATMSAGKSTLINAIIGRKILQSRNEACTSRLFYVSNKAFDDGFLSITTDKMFQLDTNSEDLMRLNGAAEHSPLEIDLGYRGLLQNCQYSFIDTPGSNSFLNGRDIAMTRKAIRDGDYDAILYVANAEQLGTDDAKSHLAYIAKYLKGKPFIVTLNKLDIFREGEDDIESSIAGIKADLKSVGLTTVFVCPVSAFAGLLCKEKLWGDSLSEFDEDDLRMLYRKFRKPYYDLSLYYDLKKDEQKKKISQDRYQEMLSRTGIVSLEEIIQGLSNLS